MFYMQEMTEFALYKCFHCPFQGSFYHLCLNVQRKKESPTLDQVDNAMCAYIEEETDYLWILKSDGSHQKYLIQTQESPTYLGCLDPVIINEDSYRYAFETFKNYQVEWRPNKPNLAFSVRNNVQSHVLELFQEYMNKDLLKLICSYLPDERKVISTHLPIQNVRFLKQGQLYLYSLKIEPQKFEECVKDPTTEKVYRIVGGLKDVWNFFCETMWNQDTQKQFTFHIGPRPSVIIRYIDIENFTSHEMNVKLCRIPFSIRVWRNFLWVVIADSNKRLAFQILRFFKNKWEIYAKPIETTVICLLTPNGGSQVQFAVHMQETKLDFQWQTYIAVYGAVFRVQGLLNGEKDWIPCDFTL